MYMNFFSQLEKSILDLKQQQQEADLAKREKERLEEMRRREQSRIMEVGVTMATDQICIPYFTINPTYIFKCFDPSYSNSHTSDL